MWMKGGREVGGGEGGWEALHQMLASFFFSLYARYHLLLSASLPSCKRDSPLKVFNMAAALLSGHNPVFPHITEATLK